MSLLFGDFELDQERRQLLRSGQPVPLEPKAYELLSLLLERRPRALSKAQIRDVVWPQTFVSESTLAVAVNAVREALGDDARHPRFIRTVHGFGYAFCGEARSAGDGHPGAGEASDDPKLAPQELKEDSDSGRSQVMPGGAKPARRSWRIVALAAAFVLLPAGWYGFSRYRTVPLEESLAAVPVTSLPGVELHPALSPDARRVAFVWDGPDRNNFDVYVKEIGSEEMVRVTKDPAPDYHPSGVRMGERSRSSGGRGRERTSSSCRRAEGRSSGWRRSPNARGCISRLCGHSGWTGRPTAVSWRHPIAARMHGAGASTSSRWRRVRRGR